MTSQAPIRTRSWLFTPATRPERFAKASQVGADVAILDLEDAVAPGDKVRARTTALEYLAGNPSAELKNPNFAAMAEAVGIRGIRIENPAKVEDGIAAAFAHDGPVLIDVVVNRTELAMPPSVTVEMAKGFSLYMVKAIMSGRADEVIDLAKTNLWR